MSWKREERGEDTTGRGGGPGGGGGLGGVLFSPYQLPLIPRSAHIAVGAGMLGHTLDSRGLWGAGTPTAGHPVPW
jgi:hypothetical protein